MQTHNYKFIPYDKKLVPRARELRNNQTKAELKFWFEVLKDKRLNEFKFTNQKPIDCFIVDFYCPKLFLVIEIDGGVHLKQNERDVERGNILKEKYGLKILRFRNEEVLNNSEEVIQCLLKHINKIQIQPPPQK